MGTCLWRQGLAGAQCQGCSGRRHGLFSAFQNGHSFPCRWRGSHAGQQLSGGAWWPDLARAPDPALHPGCAPPDL